MSYSLPCGKADCSGTQYRTFSKEATFRHLPVSLLVLLLFAFSYMMVLRIPLLFLIVPGASALLSSFLIDPLLDRHMPKE